jgi:PAS domain S-box-containing protein
MLANFNLAQKGLILVVIPLLFQLGFIYVLSGQLAQAERERNQESVYREKKEHLAKISRIIMADAGGLAIYGMKHTGGVDKEVRYKHVSDAVPAEFEALEKLSQNAPAELKDIQDLNVLATQVVKDFRRVRKDIDTNNYLVAVKQFNMLRPQIAVLEHQLQVVNDLQDKLENAGAENWSSRREEVKRVLVLATLVNILIATLLSFFFYRGTTRRLSILVDNSIRLASGVPLHPPLSGTDEIARLDQVFNMMAHTLDEAARKERAVVENAVDVIFSIDERGSLTKVSAASLQVFGYDSDDLMGRNFRVLLPADEVDSTNQKLTATKDGDASSQFESHVLKRGGALIDVLWSVHWSSEEHLYFCVAHDITERKRAENLLREAEARIRLIVESMPIGLIIIDDTGRIELNNPSVDRMFDKKTDELQGKNIGLLFGKPDTVTDSEFASDLIQKTKNHAFELEAIKPTNEVIPIEISMNEFETLEGKRHLVLVIDVTVRHEVERLKQEFISMVSHELRSPLNSVLGFLEMLPEGIYGDLNSQGKDKVNVAERNVNRLIRLINDLLEIDRTESGRLSMEIADVPIKPIIERSVDAVKTLADKENITITISDVNTIVTADGDRLVQVIVNLLSNAIKFSPQGGKITVDVLTQEDWLEVRVIDEGRGIPEQYKALIFEKFQQVTSSDWRQKGGTGLGLAISKAIIDQLNGSIGVESEEGKGSTFWFRLPLKKTATAPSEAEATVS